MRFYHLLVLVLPVALSLAVACSATNGPHHGTGGGAAGGGSTGTATADALAVSPLDAVLEIATSAGPGATLTYAARIVHADKTTADVSAAAVFSVDDATLGSFKGATFTAQGKAGTAMVSVTAGGLSASTSLTLKTLTSIITKGAPADAPGKFGGPVDAGKAPTLVYPADGVVVPPNMNVLEIQFQPGAGNNLFELAFSAATIDVKVYLTCAVVGSGCAYTPDAAVWKLVSDAARGKPPITYTLRGVDANNPQTVGVSAARAIAFSAEDMVGGLYYWNAGAGTTMRYEFGVSGQTAETYMNAATAGATMCVGCHVVSRDGKKIAIGFDIPAPAGYKVFDVATKKALFGQGGLFSNAGANFFAFSPDSAQLMTSNGNTIVLRDAATGTVITDPLVAAGTMPDWSPDGKRLVYAKGAPVPFGLAVPGVDKASLESMTFDGAAWHPGPTLVPFAGQNNYYPSFSPDSQWVLYNRSASDADSFANAAPDPDAGTMPDGELWAVSAAGGAPLRLTAASSPGASQWPKWAPVTHHYYGGSILWLTFSSARPYGLRLAQGQTTQLWMVGFDPALAAAGKDPSLPAFWLPFQDLASGNHIAQWVVKVERKPCAMTSDCAPGEACQGGTCEPVLK